MSLKRNVVASLASQVYITVASVVALPLYVKYMGAEAYGLVGFFTVLLAWFSVLDVGLSATVARETARFHGGALDALGYRRFVRAVEGVFAVVGTLGGGALFAAAGLIGRGWLVVQELSETDVARAIQLMAVIVALRWMCGLYRGTVSGAERLVWLGVFNVVIATLRSLGVIGILALGWTRPAHFFAYQAGVAVLELLLLAGKAYALLPPVSAGRAVPWSWAPLKPVLRFSTMSGLASIAAALASQADKLVLSKVLPLAQYGYFSLAVAAAGGVGLIGGPVAGALLPRITRMQAEGEQAASIEVYRRATQFVAVFAGAASLTLAFCAEPLLLAWTGNTGLATQAAPILRLYALGNGVVAVGGLQYLLQYAKGDLRLHAIGSVAIPLVLVPAVIWAARRHGAVGAGYAFLGVNLASLLAYVSLVHSRFAPGLNARWYAHDTTLIFATMAAIGAVAHAVFPAPSSRLWLAGFLVAFGAVLTVAGACASSMMRRKLTAWTRHDHGTVEVE